MSNNKVYTAVSIHSFRNVTRDITFDLYLKISDDNYAHVFSRTTGLDYKRLASYSGKGVTELFIRAEDKGLYDIFISRTAESIFADASTSQEKKIATLLNMTEQNMAEIFSQFDLGQETVDSSQKVIHNYVTLMTQEPKTLATILRLVSHGEYLYYHSIAVGIFSIILAKATGQFDQKTIEMVGLGGFFHDIGNSHLPREVYEKEQGLLVEQLDLKKTHCKLGLQMLENTPNVPDEVRWIVYQHHEEPGGRGYPNQLTASAIYYPAKIVGLVDEFSCLISQRPGRSALTADKAIEFLRSRPDQFDADLVKLLGSVFLRAMSQAA
ncbi:MAG: HD domain-containing protein [Methylotenera sp.]|nr:HD domain-containing protein [Oligoflexia bacterium]